jgi:hypothetical protein
MHRSHLAHPWNWCGYVSFQERIAMGFDGTATTKGTPFHALGKVLPKSPLFKTHIKPK